MLGSAPGVIETRAVESTSGHEAIHSYLQDFSFCNFENWTHLNFKFFLEERYKFVVRMEVKGSAL